VLVGRQEGSQEGYPAF